MSSFIFLASPQNKHPTPNIVYAKRMQAFLPKMSLNFPYRGWKDVKVMKYLEDISVS